MKHPLFPLFLLMFALLSGCLEHQPSPELEPVKAITGEGTYTYQGEDGSRLEVTIQGIQTRADAYLHSHESLVLEYRYHPPSEPGQPFVFQEAISLDDGLIIQQAVLCSPSKDCTKDSPMIYFGAHGLPGGFGMGPLWAAGGFTPDGELAIRSQVYTKDILVIRSENAFYQGEACQKISYEPLLPELWLFYARFSGITSYSVVCPHQAMPVFFQSAYPYSRNGRAVAYELIDHQEKGLPVAWESDARSRNGVPHLFEMRVWNASGPRYLFDDSAFMEFSLIEAHTEALRLDERYRALFNQTPNATISQTFSGLWGSSTAGQVGPVSLGTDSESYIRNMIIDTGFGRPLMFVLEKEIQDPDGERSISYRMIEPRESDLKVLQETPSLDLSILPDEQVDPFDAVTFFDELFDEDLFSVNFGHRLARDHPNDPLVNTQGYQLRLYKRTDSEPESDTFATFGVNELSIDGPSGSLLRMNYPRDQMPLEGYTRDAVFD